MSEHADTGVLRPPSRCVLNKWEPREAVLGQPSGRLSDFRYVHTRAQISHAGTRCILYADPTPLAMQTCPASTQHTYWSVCRRSHQLRLHTRPHTVKSWDLLWKRAPALNLTSQDPGNSRVLGPGKWSFLLQSPGDDTSTPASCRYCIRGALLAMCIGAAHRTRNSAQLSSGSKFASLLAQQCLLARTRPAVPAQTQTQLVLTLQRCAREGRARESTSSLARSRSWSVVSSSSRCKQPGCPRLAMRTRTSSSSNCSTCTCQLQVESSAGRVEPPAPLLSSLTHTLYVCRRLDALCSISASGTSVAPMPRRSPLITTNTHSQISHSTPLLRLHPDFRQGSGAVLEKEDIRRIALVLVQQVSDAIDANVRHGAVHDRHV